MKWLGFKKLRFSSVVMNVADIRKRSKAAHVADLAGDIQAHGAEPIQAPTVRAKTKELVCGRDRMAALMMLKAKSVWVHLVECTDDEAAELEISENAYRRAENRAELIASLMRLKEQHLRAVAQDVKGDSVPDRTDASDKAIKVQARKEVARATGISPASVKKAEQRAAKSEAPAAAPVSADQDGRGAAAAALVMPTPFEDFGLPMSEHERAVTIDLIEQLKEWEQGTKNLLSELTRLEKATTEPVLAPALAAGIREDAHRLGHALRNAVPCGRCYYCKGKPELRAACFACGGTGLAGRQSGNDVPKELRAGGAGARVAVNGRFVPYHEVAPAEVARPKANGKSKGIRIVDADDRELTVELDAEERY